MHALFTVPFTTLSVHNVTFDHAGNRTMWSHVEVGNSRIMEMSPCPNVLYFPAERTTIRWGSLEICITNTPRKLVRDPMYLSVIAENLQPVHENEEEAPILSLFIGFMHDLSRCIIIPNIAKWIVSWWQNKHIHNLMDANLWNHSSGNIKREKIIQKAKFNDLMVVGCIIISIIMIHLETKKCWMKFIFFNLFYKINMSSVFIRWRLIEIWMQMNRRNIPKSVSTEFRIAETHF